MLFHRAVLASAICAVAIFGGGCQPAKDSALAKVGGSEPISTASLDVAPAPLPTITKGADFGGLELTAGVRYVADRVVNSDDAHGLPFLIVDKTVARVVAFDAGGRLIGISPVLLGLARGDDSVPGIGERRIADIRPEERTTPAGRFEAELGENTHGDDILWVDYDNAVSMHRLRAVKASQKRLQRLASATAADNRISYGCINVPAAFYDSVVKRLFAPRNGIVYVLPETRPIETLFSQTSKTVSR